MISLFPPPLLGLLQAHLWIGKDCCFGYLSHGTAMEALPELHFSHGLGRVVWFSTRGHPGDCHRSDLPWEITLAEPPRWDADHSAQKHLGYDRGEAEARQSGLFEHWCECPNPSQCPCRPPFIGEVSMQPPLGQNPHPTPTRAETFARRARLGGSCEVTLRTTTVGGVGIVARRPKKPPKVFQA